MYDYEFTTQAVKDLKKLPKSIQKTIISKLDFYVSSTQPLFFAHRLVNNDLGQYRFRVGDYRVIFDVEEEKIIILTLGHRREIYK